MGQSDQPGGHPRRIIGPSGSSGLNLVLTRYRKAALPPVHVPFLYRSIRENIMRVFSRLAGVYKIARIKARKASNDAGLRRRLLYDLRGGRGVSLQIER